MRFLTLIGIVNIQLQEKCQRYILILNRPLRFHRFHNCPPHFHNSTTPSPLLHTPHRKFHRRAPQTETPSQHRLHLTTFSTITPHQSSFIPSKIASLSLLTANLAHNLHLRRLIFRRWPQQQSNDLRFLRQTADPNVTITSNTSIAVCVIGRDFGEWHSQKISIFYIVRVRCSVWLVHKMRSFLC